MTLWRRKKNKLHWSTGDLYSNLITSFHFLTKERATKKSNTTIPSSAANMLSPEGNHHLQSKWYLGRKNLLVAVLKALGISVFLPSGSENSSLVLPENHDSF